MPDSTVPDSSNSADETESESLSSSGSQEKSSSGPQMGPQMGPQIEPLMEQMPEDISSQSERRPPSTQANGESESRTIRRNDSAGDKTLSDEDLAIAESWQYLPLDARLVPKQSGCLTRVGFGLLILVICWLPIQVHGMCWSSLLLSLVIFALIAPVIFKLKKRPAVIMIGAVAIFIFASLEIWNLTGFNTLSLSGPPPKILWCGAAYQKAAETVAPPAHETLLTVGTTPAGSPILSPKRCGSGLPLRTIYLKGPNNSVFKYALF